MGRSRAGRRAFNGLDGAVKGWKGGVLGQSNVKRMRKRLSVAGIVTVKGWVVSCQ